jgi:endonuclease G
MNGYNPLFFSDCTLPLPQLTAAQKKQRAPLIGKSRSFELAFTHFSIVLNKDRKFAFFTATNIDGKQWNALVEQGEDFSFDSHVLPAYQTGNELYNLHSGTGINDFDKGHLVKFQDPQWGSETVIKQAASETMRFANCVPQHHSLNRGAWKSLEDYIVKKFTKKSGADGQKITVFSGPMLLPQDPFYIDAVNGVPFQIPVHFWKVVVYQNKSGLLSAVAFLMSQKAILLKHNFVTESKGLVNLAPAPETDFFADFTKGEPYQVRVDFIEQTTGLKFGLQNLQQPYTKQEPTEIIFKRVEIPVSSRQFSAMPLSEKPLHFTFEAITL